MRFIKILNVFDCLCASMSLNFDVGSGGIMKK
jgi:hypothetical protein